MHTYIAVETTLLKVYVPPKRWLQSIKLHDVTFRQFSTPSRYLEPSDAKCQEKLEITDQHFDVETSRSMSVTSMLDVVWNVQDKWFVRLRHITVPCWPYLSRAWRLDAGFSSRWAGFASRTVREAIRFYRSGSGPGSSRNTFLFPCQIRVLRHYVSAFGRAPCSYDCRNTSSSSLLLLWLFNAVGENFKIAVLCNVGRFVSRRAYRPFRETYLPHI